MWIDDCQSAALIPELPFISRRIVRPFVFVLCRTPRKYDVGVGRVGGLGHRVTARPVPESPDVAEPFLRLPGMMMGCGVQGWAGE